MIPRELSGSEIIWTMAQFMTRCRKKKKEMASVTGLEIYISGV